MNVNVAQSCLSGRPHRHVLVTIGHVSRLRSDYHSNQAANVDLPVVWIAYKGRTSVFPTEHFLHTRTQVRHECTQVHGEKRSSKLAKSISMLFGADKPLICHSEKRCTRAKSRILSFRKPCACMRSLSRHGLLGGFSVKFIFMVNFLKEPHGPWMPCNHFCIHLKRQKTGTSAKGFCTKDLVKFVSLWTASPFRTPATG